MSSWINAHLVLQGANTWFVVVLCVRSHNTVLMSSGISYVPVFLMINLAKKRGRLLKLWPQDHVASCWRSQIRCHAPGISQPLIGGDFSLPVWLCTEVGWDLFTLHQHWTVVPAWEQPHPWLLWRYPEEDLWPHLVEKRCLGQEGLCSLWKKRCFTGVKMKASTPSSPSIRGLLVSRIASGIPFEKHSLGQTPLLAPIP